MDPERNRQHAHVYREADAPAVETSIRQRQICSDRCKQDGRAGRQRLDGFSPGDVVADGADGDCGRTEQADQLRRNQHQGREGAERSEDQKQHHETLPG